MNSQPREAGLLGVAEFPVTAARVRVRKPDVVLEPPVEFAAVVVERRRL